MTRLELPIGMTATHPHPEEHRRSETLETPCRFWEKLEGLDMDEDTSTEAKDKGQLTSMRKTKLKVVPKEREGLKVGQRVPGISGRRSAFVKSLVLTSPGFSEEILKR